MDVLENIKPSVRELSAYALPHESGEVRINQNENPWDVPLRLKQETMTRLGARAWSRYPDSAPSSLHTKLARFAGWTPDGVLVGNGSGELIQALLLATVGEGKRVLISEPTFPLYRQIATVLGAEVLSVPLTPELAYDVDAIKRALEESEPCLTIIASPNNPTGCLMSDDDLTTLLQTTRGLVAVDEAYFEFSGQTAAPLLARHPNLVVLRSFSAAMALAALRVGYLLAAPALAREIGKAMLPYNLNVISQTAAEVAVDLYETDLRPLVEGIVSERARLFVELQRIEGLTPVASQSNFMVVRSDIEPRKVFRELLTRGNILIRDVSDRPLLENYFRVSVGAPQENDLLISALRHLFWKA